MECAGRAERRRRSFTDDRERCRSRLRGIATALQTRGFTALSGLPSWIQPMTSTPDSVITSNSKSAQPFGVRRQSGASTALYADDRKRCRSRFRGIATALQTRGFTALSNPPSGIQPMTSTPDSVITSNSKSAQPFGVRRQSGASTALYADDRKRCRSRFRGIATALQTRGFTALSNPPSGIQPMTSTPDSVITSNSKSAQPFGVRRQCGASTAL